MNAPTHRCTIRRVDRIVHRIHGWDAACRCGWTSDIQVTRAAADFEARAHLVMIAKRDAPPFDTPPQED